MSNTRDILRAEARRLKNKYGVKIERNELSSIEDCRNAIDKVILKANKEKLDRIIINLYQEQKYRNCQLREEIDDLKIELENLRNKKWWQIWK